MDVLVVAQQPEARWAVAAALGLPAAAACAPDLAASRLAHPSSPLPEAVLLLVRDDADVVWLRQHVARRCGVPVVAVVDTPQLGAQAREAGAAAAVEDGAAADTIARALRAATAPGVVVDLDRVRSA